MVYRRNGEGGDRDVCYRSSVVLIRYGSERVAELEDVEGCTGTYRSRRDLLGAGTGRSIVEGEQDDNAMQTMDVRKVGRVKYAGLGRS